LDAAFCASLLNDAIKYGLNERTQIRLLQGVISNFLFKRTNTK
jgi:hypothetical protein